MRWMPFAIAFAALVPVAADAAPRCGTTERLAMFGVPKQRPAKLLLAGPKALRDGFAGGHQAKTSANFAVRWLGAPVADVQATALLAALEEGYALYTNTFAQTPPAGSANYLINVYVSNGVDDVPAIDFDGGYAWIDDGGYPYVVLSKAVFASDETMKDVAVHELYHDFQLSTGAFENSNWYWEATAEWAAQEVMPDSSYAYAFVGAWALAEELPIDYFGDPFGDDPVIGVHQYGASVFPKYLTNTFNDRSLVPHTWSKGTANDNPLRVLMGLVASSPDQAADIFGEFAAHHVLWDIPHGDIIKPWVTAYQQQFPEHERVDGKVAVGEARDWTSPSVLPHAYGYDLIEIARPADGALHVELRGNAVGSAGTPVQWRATLVRRGVDGAQYLPLPSTGSVDAVVEPFNDRVYLAVAAVAETENHGETFGFQYRVNPPIPEPQPEPTPPRDDGLCNAGGSPSWLVLVAMAGTLARRARRRGSRPAL